MLEPEFGLAEEGRAHQAPHLGVFGLGFQESEGFGFIPSDAVATHFLHLSWESLAKVVEPAHAKVQAGCILLFAGGRDGFLHRCNGFVVAAKVGLQNGKVEKGVLVEGSVTVLHSVVKVSV